MILIRTKLFYILSVIFVAFVFARVATAYDPNDVTDQTMKKPQALEAVGIDENLGDQVTLSLEFKDENGHATTLGKYFDNKRPVILSMVYFNCPSLCNFHLNGLTKAIKQLKWDTSNDFQLVAVSMNHNEGSDVAGPKLKSYLEEYGKDPSGRGWHFLTGTEENVKKLAKEIGFNFKWLPERQDFAHASAAIIMTPGGQISRYLHGVQFLPQTIKLALLESSKGNIGNIVEKVLMFCFLFDPQKNKYTLYAWNLMRIGGLLMVIVLSIFLLPMWLRERRRKQRA